MAMLVMGLMMMMMRFDDPLPRNQSICIHCHFIRVLRGCVVLLNLCVVAAQFLQHALVSCGNGGGHFLQCRSRLLLVLLPNRDRKLEIVSAWALLQGDDEFTDSLQCLGHLGCFFALWRQGFVNVLLKMIDSNLEHVQNRCQGSKSLSTIFNSCCGLLPLSSQRNKRRSTLCLSSIKTLIVF